MIPFCVCDVSVNHRINSTKRDKWKGLFECKAHDVYVRGTSETFYR